MSDGKPDTERSRRLATRLLVALAACCIAAGVLLYGLEVIDGTIASMLLAAGILLVALRAIWRPRAAPRTGPAPAAKPTAEEDHIRCPRCGSTWPAEQPICRRCGAALLPE